MKALIITMLLIAHAAAWFAAGWHIHKAQTKPKLVITRKITLPDGITEEERQALVHDLVDDIKRDIDEASKP